MGGNRMSDLPRYRTLKKKLVSGDDMTELEWFLLRFEPKEQHSKKKFRDGLKVLLWGKG